MKKYLVKIEESVLPQSYTFDQLIDAGLLDNVDDKIKVNSKVILFGLLLVTIHSLM